MSRSRLTVGFLAIVFILLYALYVVIPFIKGYDYFLNYAASLINKKQRLSAIQNSFPIHRFLVIRNIVLLVGVAISVLAVSAVKHASAIASFVFKITVALKNAILHNKKRLASTSVSSKAVLCFSILYLILQSIWYMLHLPFIHDEAYTISNFVLPGPLASITFYPYPNNHILFSLFSYPFSFLPVKPEVAFRLPSLVASIAATIIFFKLLVQFFSPFIASLGVAVYCCLLPVISYAIFARGYCLVFLFTILSIYTILRFVTTSRRLYKGLFIIFSIAGFYTLPSYLYPFVAIYSFYVFYAVSTRNYPTIKDALTVGLVIGVCTLLLYSPVILTSGGWNGFYEVLYQGYAPSYSLNNTWAYVQDVYSLQFYGEMSITIIFLAIITLLVISTVIKIALKDAQLPEKMFFFICLIGFLMPLFSFVLQHKMIAARTHSYVAVFFVGLLFICVKIINTKKWAGYIFISIAIFFVILNASLTRRSGFLFGEKYSGETADLFAGTMLQASNKNDTCYTFDITYLATIQLKYALHKQQLTVYQSDAGSPSSAAFSFDNSYGWLIAPINNPSTINIDSLKALYHIKVRRRDVALWERNNR